ncbi:SRA-YDG [Imleria badia]|nr:SRA-YDG [Imleria badia]
MSPSARRYGHIPGVGVNTHFRTKYVFSSSSLVSDFYPISRTELKEAGVHGQPRRGIYGDPKRGAFAICLSGGYEDNEDYGDRIVYAGSGGQMNRRQIVHQSFDDADNKSLYASWETKRPVRVIRGADKNKDYYNPHAPTSGYRYDGLFVVDSCEIRQGMAGFNMCFFELSRIAEQGEVPEA